jgi:hypothetical protein
LRSKQYVLDSGIQACLLAAAVVCDTATGEDDFASVRVDACTGIIAELELPRAEAARKVATHGTPLDAHVASRCIETATERMKSTPKTFGDVMVQLAPIEAQEPTRDTQCASATEALGCDDAVVKQGDVGHTH